MGGPTSSAAQSAAMPDFAFPAKVSTDSRRKLDKALRSHNDPEMLRALMDLTLAGSVISPDTLRPALNRIDSIIVITPSASTRSLLRLIQATILSNAYSAKSWIYDRRQTPSTPIPADYTEWSGSQFRTVTDSLLNMAIADTAALKATPLSKFSSVISIPRGNSQLTSNLLSFIALKSIDIRKSMLSGESIPLSVLNHPDFTKDSPSQISSILNLYGLLLSNLPQTSPPSPTYIQLEAQRIDFIASHVYPSERRQADIERSKLFYNMFLSCRATASAPYALLTLTNAQTVLPSDTIAPAMATYLRETIARYPSFYAINCLKNTLNTLIQPEADITTQQSVIPGGEVTVTVNARNLNDLRLTLYRIDTPRFSTDSYYTLSKGMKRPQEIATQTVRFSGTAPFVADTTVTFTIPDVGQYIIVPQIAGHNELTERNYRIINATHFALGLMTFTERNAIVVNQFTGEPISNAQLKLLPRANNPTLQTIASTNEDGMATLASDISGNLFVEKDGDSFAAPRFVYPYHPNSEKSYNIDGFTDLPLYHPGDSVGWLAIVYSIDGKEREAIEGKRIRAVMTDANNQPVDTIIATTDPFGRITGKFITPKDRLTGQYSIRFDAENSQERIYGNVWFTISDYKLPTFQVVISSINRNNPEGGATIIGSATTYSGMPVSYAEVKLAIASMPGFGRFYSPEKTFYSMISATDSAGWFSISVPSEAFNSSSAPKGIFSASVTVTSAAGESHEISRIFSLGKSFAITANPDADIDASQPAQLNLKLINSEGDDIKEPVKLSIYPDDTHSTAIANLTIVPGGTVDFDKIPSGIYTFQFSHSDADTLTINNIALYRLTDALPPRTTPVWVPTHDYIVGQPIVFGTSHPNSYVLVTTYNDSVITSQKWMKLAPGIHTLTPKMSTKDEKLTINFLSTYKYQTTSADVTVTNPAAKCGITIQSSTFRDRLIPGSAETWTLTVTAANGAPASAGLVLDVYDAAIRQLATPSWTFHPRIGHTPNLWVTNPIDNPTIYYGVTHPFDYLNCPGIEVPEFETYGLTLGPNNRYSVKRMLYAARNASASNGIADSKMVMKKEVVTETAFDSGAPTMAGASADEINVEETALEATDEQSMPLRLGNIPLALFRPMLTTDSDGRAVCTFTFPNANTTWSFNAIAFTRNMLANSFSTEVTASKIIMVTPNPPRFMRMGDTAIIPSTVANSSDSTLTAKTIVSTFRIADDSIISSDTTFSIISPGQSVVVNHSITAPSDEPFIGFRIVSSANGYSDGEQLLIPLLPATTPVIESNGFYLTPGDTTVSVKIEPTDSAGHTILTYCDNPLWYAVTALPGLRETNLSTSTAAAVSLFSAAVSEGLLNRQPLLAQALHEWTEAANSDSLLTSMLYKNNELKTLLLNATPWVEAAASDSERMARLALLFDSQTVNTSINQAIDNLTSLQMPDGGFKWSAGSLSSSEWATFHVLNTLGRLNALNMLPRDKRLSKLTERALSFIEASEIKHYHLYPSGDYTQFANLVALWPNWKLSTAGAKVKAAAISSMLKKWKKMDVRSKIESAATLYKSGYPTVAKTILESVRLYAVTSPIKGMWWPSVTDISTPEEAIATTSAAAQVYYLIDPQNDEINLIRQWLIDQKQAMNWGTGKTATEAVAAIITTSPKWIEKADKVHFSLSGLKLEIPTHSQWTGEIHYTLPPLSSTDTLNITRSPQPAAPAWGAVTSFTNRSLAGIEAHSMPDISITKRMYALAADGSPRAISDEFTRGSKVRIELTITTRRAMDYVVITDERAAGLEPVDQLPGMVASDGAFFYRENLDTQTDLFIDRLPAGTYILTYDAWANNSGTFSSGVATIQSQLTPTLTAHSSSAPIHIH